MKLSFGLRYLAFVGAVGLLAGAITACGSPLTHMPTDASASRAVTTASFAGYKWKVVTITHNEKTTPIPAKYLVYLQFTRNGQFGANEPVNYHSGIYKVTSGGFTTSQLASTLVGWTGSDPVILLSIKAISAFDNGARALTRVSGTTLTITVNGYTLIAQRDGTQANWPSPKGTSAS